MITWMKKTNSFQIAKVQPENITWLLVVFWQFQPGVAYKSVAYKKACNCKQTSYLLQKEKYLFCYELNSYFDDFSFIDLSLYFGFWICKVHHKGNIAVGRKYFSVKVAIPCIFSTVKSK